MSLTAEDVAEIIRLLDRSDFDSLDLEMGGLKLRLRRGANGEVAEARSDPVAGAAGKGFGPVAGDLPPEPAAKDDVAPLAAASPPASSGLADIPSPLLGIFYRAPKPGAPPFVELGQAVEEDTIIGIIEVMKLMNSIRAGMAGIVADIPAANGALVEYGEPLIRVRPGG